MVADSRAGARGVGVIIGCKTDAGKGASAQRCDDEGVRVHDECYVGC